MTNDYYDFNPSATTWVLLLSGIVLFVLALSILLIVMVNRGTASGPVGTVRDVRRSDERPTDIAAAPEPLHEPTAKAS